MTFANWCLFLGMLLLIMSISDSLLKKIPFSPAADYMIPGITAGPYGLKLIDQMTQVVLFTVAASVVLHGISATSIMTVYKNRKRRGKSKDGIS